MTLGEYADKITSVIIRHGLEPSIANALIAGTEGELLARNISTRDRQWFWREVADQLSARRLVVATDVGLDPLSHARDKVLQHLERISA